MSDPAQLPPDLAAQFGDLFGDLFGRAAGGSVSASGDLRVDLNLTFDEAVTGARKTVAIMRAHPCEPCAGRGCMTPGAERTPCATCAGTGHRIHQQGLFSVQTVCAACKGARGAFADPCSACAGAGPRSVRGELAVAVPAGILDGQTLRLPNAGNTRADGERGSCFVAIHVVAPPDRQNWPAARVMRGVAPAARTPVADRLAIAVAVLVLAAALYWLVGG